MLLGLQYGHIQLKNVVTYWKPSGNYGWIALVATKDSHHYMKNGSSKVFKISEKKAYSIIQKEALSQEISTDESVEIENYYQRHPEERV